MSDPDKMYQDFEREKADIARKVRRLTVWGLVITVGLLGGAGWFAFAQWEHVKTMRPNEWGDFLAGWLGPVGILWLIVGYLQQGLELRQNTRALDQQARELKDSVTQQRQLVEETRRQIELERNWQWREEERRSQEAQLRIVVEGVTTKLRENFDEVEHPGWLDLRNIGGEVSEVTLTSSPPITFRESTWPRWPRSEKKSINWFFHPELANTIVYVFFSYVDALGKAQSQTFELVHLLHEEVVSLHEEEGYSLNQEEYYLPHEEVVIRREFSVDFRPSKNA